MHPRHFTSNEPDGRFRYPIGVLPGNVQVLQDRSLNLYERGTLLYLIFEQIIPFVMGVLVILFFFFTTIYLGFSLVRLYYSDTLKPYKKKTLRALGKHHHYYRRGESGGSAKFSSMTATSRRSKRRRPADDQDKYELTNESDHKSIKNTPGGGDNGLNNQSVISMTSPPNRKPSAKSYPPVIDFMTTPRSRATLRAEKGVNREGETWEWGKNWMARSAAIRAEHRKSVESLRSIRSQLKTKASKSFTKMVELAASDASAPNLTQPVEKVAIPVVKKTPEVVPVSQSPKIAPAARAQQVPPTTPASQPAFSPAQGQGIQQVSGTGDGQTIKPSYSAGGTISSRPQQPSNYRSAISIRSAAVPPAPPQSTVSKTLVTQPIYSPGEVSSGPQAAESVQNIGPYSTTPVQHLPPPTGAGYRKGRALQTSTGSTRPKVPPKSKIQKQIRRYDQMPSADTQEHTKEGNVQEWQDNKSPNEYDETEDHPPPLTPQAFSHLPQKKKPVHARPPIWEEPDKARPVTPSRAELYTRYTFKPDTTSSKMHTSIPKQKKMPWDKGFTIIRGGPRRNSKDIEEIKEQRKSMEAGSDFPPNPTTSGADTKKTSEKRK